MSKAILISPQTKTATDKLRVAAYCRVSSTSTDQLNSYENQVNYYRDMINKKENWELVEIFADEGITGTSVSKRAEFNRMIKACELKQIDLIITKSVSRFARNVKESLEYVRKLKLLGIAVQFEKESINTLSLGDEMLINTFSSIAQEESISISNNLKFANRKRMEHGEYINATAPYGFIFQNKALIPYEPEARIVRNMYEWYLNGLSTADIAERLNNMRIITKKGTNKWRATRVALILSNEKNVGDTLFQKSCNVGFPYKQIKNNGIEDKYYVSNTHTGIIDKDTYNAVQKLLIQRQIKNTRKTEITQYPLTGKIRCEECGSYYRRRIVKGTIKWSCAKHLEDKYQCNSNYIDESLIYNAIITIINNLRFNNNDIIEQSIRNLEYATRIIRIKNTDIKNANIEIKDLNAKLLMIEKLRSKGYISQEVYALQANEIRTQISKINNRKRISTKSKIDEALTDIKILNQKLESIPSPLTSFDENLFNNIITSISITKDKILTVTFIGNLQFSEKI